MNGYLESFVAHIGSHPLLAIAIVFLISVGEAVFIVGLFVPSTAVLVGAGTLIGLGKLPFWPIFVAASLGATIGDALSFWIGSAHKERLKRVWPFSRYRTLIEHGERFFVRHGGKSIFIARFIPGVKSVLPAIAGMMGMGIAQFALVNGISALAWSGAHIIPSMGLGHGIAVSGFGSLRPIALAISVIGVTAAAWYAVKRSRRWLWPGLAQLLKVPVEWLSSRSSRLLHHARRVLANETAIRSAAIWGVTGLIAASCIVALLLDLSFDPELSAAAHKTSVADLAMVADASFGTA